MIATNEKQPLTVTSEMIQAGFQALRSWGRAENEVSSCLDEWLLRDIYQAMSQLGPDHEHLQRSEQAPSQIDERKTKPDCICG
jgi:hypothetical protein